MREVGEMAGCRRVIDGLAVLVVLGSGACDGPNALDAWPAEIEVRAAGSQSGLAGYAVNEPPAVRLLDMDGNPISGAKITFTVAVGGGSVTGAVATTGADGVATVGGWSVTAGDNVLTASMPAPFRVAPVRFTATGLDPAYQIALTYVTPTSQARQAVFANAAARWQSAIYGDVPDVSLNSPPEDCFGNAVAESIDDLKIFVRLDSIDGPSGILGRAGPCLVRLTGLLPIVGLMEFDTADVAGLEQAGQFDEVIMHEMGHVLGFGGLWQPMFLNLIAGGGSGDPYFLGAQARVVFDRSGGSGYLGNKVPVENVGGPGTRDAHWRESVFARELMTGFLNVGVANPFSAISIAAMGDEGYLVNYAAGDAYGVLLAPPRAGAAGAGAGVIALGDDVLRLPITVVDRAGRVTATYRP